MAEGGFQEQLDGLDRDGRRRRLLPAEGRDFASNDYLGLSRHPRLRDAVAAALDDGMPVGAGASRLLRGNHPAHEALEAKAARFFQAPAALYMGTGYLANSGLFAALPHRHDLIVFDALIHASAKEGIHASAAKRVKVTHNDANAVEDAIRRWRAGGGSGRPWIAVESVYSMDGDIAPLDDLAAIAERHDAMLVVDEAHATGVLGVGGRGLAQALDGRGDVIVLHTCGKALGASGALVCAAAPVIDLLINRCRPFVYSTAPSPLMAVAVAAALDVLESEPELPVRLANLVVHARRRLAGLPGLVDGGTQILPIIVGGETAALAAAEALQTDGFDVRAIRPPTVPDGTSRLRLSLSLNVSAGDVDALADALPRVLPSPAVGRRTGTD